MISARDMRLILCLVCAWMWRSGAKNETQSPPVFPRALVYAYHESELCALNLKFFLDFGKLSNFPDLLVSMRTIVSLYFNVLQL